MPARRLRFTPDLRGKTAVVIAGGASLTREDCETARNSDAVLIGVNDAYRIVQLDVLYGSDHPWWAHHWKNLKDYPACLMLTQIHGNVQPINLPVWYVEGVNGSDMQAKTLHFGGNSGFAAVHLASLWGAAKIVLLGFDMQLNGRRHWFGDHPGGMNKKSDYSRMIRAFEGANCPTPIVNCTRETALTCFPRKSLEEVL